MKASLLGMTIEAKLRYRFIGSKGLTEKVIAPRSPGANGGMAPPLRITPSVVPCPLPANAVASPLVLPSSANRSRPADAEPPALNRSNVPSWNATHTGVR